MEEKKSEKFSAVRDYDGFCGVRVYHARPNNTVKDGKEGFFFDNSQNFSSMTRHLLMALSLK